MWSLHSPVVTNAQGDLKWQYGPRSIWKATGSESADVWVKRLESGVGVLPNLIEFIRLLTNDLHQTSRVPSVSVGDLDGIGKASSGRAFEIAMTPAKELVAEKENAAVPQEYLLMEELVARMVYYGDLTGKTYSLEGHNMPDAIDIRKRLEKMEITFTPLSFPQEVIPETISGQVAAKIRSQKDAIQHLHPTWSEDKVDEEVKQIAGESGTDGDTSAESNIAALRARITGQA
jgi:hypothetical protein